MTRPAATPAIDSIGALLVVTVAFALAGCPEAEPSAPDATDSFDGADAEVQDVPAETARVTIFVNGVGQGKVTSDPPGIACGTTCSADFEEGQSITLMAVPALANAFGGFGGGVCEGINACTFVVDGPADVAVTWQPHGLAVTAAGVVSPVAGTTGDDRVTGLAPSSFGTVFAAQSGDSSTLLRLSPQPGAPDLLWSHRFGPALASCPDLMVTSNAGAVGFVAGHGGEGTELNPGAAPAVDGAGTFVSAYQDGGAHAWAHVSNAGCPTAIDATQTVVAWTGEVTGADAAVSGLLGASDNATSWVVASYDAATGAPTWSRAFGTADFDVARGRAIAVDDQGAIVTAGRVVNTGEIDLGGGPLPSGASVVVAKFGADGTHQWSRNYGGLDHDVSELTLLLDGTIAMAGVQRVEAEDVVYVSKLAASGETLWTTTYSYATQQGVGAMIQTTGGDLLVSGWRYIPTDGLSNMTLTRIGADGGLTWREELGSQGGEERALALARGDSGWWVGGWFSGNAPWNIDVGTTPLALSAVDGSDGVVLKVEEVAP